MTERLKAAQSVVEQNRINQISNTEATKSNTGLRGDKGTLVLCE